MTTISMRVCDRCNQTIDGNYWSLTLMPEHVRGTSVFLNHKGGSETSITRDYCVPCSETLLEWVKAVPPGTTK